MTSYQRRLKEIRELKLDVQNLKDELEAKGNIFFIAKKWLGFGKEARGTVVDGKIVQLSEYPV